MRGRGGMRTGGVKPGAAKPGPTGGDAAGRPATFKPNRPAPTNQLPGRGRIEAEGIKLPAPGKNHNRNNRGR
jgi:hypothetical protein